jgi:hypothetical protein
LLFKYLCWREWEYPLDINQEDRITAVYFSFHIYTISINIGLFLNSRGSVTYLLHHTQPAWLIVQNKNQTNKPPYFTKKTNKASEIYKNNLLYAFTYNRNITHNFICINIHFYIFALNNCKSI